MKDNKLYVLIILLIISVVFHGIITRPNDLTKERYDISSLENEICVFDNDEGKLYCKSIPQSIYYEDWTLFLDINELK